MTELIDRISAALVGLKMPRALEALGPTLRRLEQGETAAVEAIDALLSEDCALRETRRIDIALRTAKLLPVKTVESFDFAFQPSLDRERIAALAQLDFIRRRETVHFLGPPGTGKSHLATALGVAAVKAGKSVCKTTLAEPAESLAKAERQGRLAEKIRFFARAALLVVDEIGYLPITQGGASLFFQIVNASCEKGAMILTSNRSFAEWGDIFGDPVVATAFLDRLLHHAVVVRIEGASYRPGKHADLIPEHVWTNAPITPPPPPKKRGRPKTETRTDDRTGSPPKHRKVGNFTSALTASRKGKSKVIAVDVEDPMEAVLDRPVVAEEFQQPLRRNLRAHDEVADGPSTLSFHSRIASILPTALRPGQPCRSRSPQTGEFTLALIGERAVARRTALERHELAQKLVFAPRERTV